METLSTSDVLTLVGFVVFVSSSLLFVAGLISYLAAKAGARMDKLN